MSTENYNLSDHFKSDIFDQRIECLIVDLNKQIEHKNITPYIIAFYYEHQGMRVTAHIDTIENNQKTVNKSNIWNAKEFKKSLNGGILTPDLFSPIIGCSLQIGDYIHFGLCESDVSYIDHLIYDMYCNRGTDFETPYLQLVKSVYSRNSLFRKYDGNVLIVCNGIGNESKYVWYPDHEKFAMANK